MKYNTNTMDKLKILYQNFISMKKYFWTHCLMAIGWIVFFASLAATSCIEDNIIGPYCFFHLIMQVFIAVSGLFLGIPILLLIIIETGIKKYTNSDNNKPHIKFIYSPIYNSIWIGGILLISYEIFFFLYIAIGVYLES